MVCAGTSGTVSAGEASRSCTTSADATRRTSHQAGGPPPSTSSGSPGWRLKSVPSRRTSVSPGVAGASARPRPPGPVPDRPGVECLDRLEHLRQLAGTGHALGARPRWIGNTSGVPGDAMTVNTSHVVAATPGRSS